MGWSQAWFQVAWQALEPDHNSESTSGADYRRGAAVMTRMHGWATGRQWQPEALSPGGPARWGTARRDSESAGCKARQPHCRSESVPRDGPGRGHHYTAVSKWRARDQLANETHAVTCTMTVFGGQPPEASNCEKRLGPGPSAAAAALDQHLSF